MMRVPSALLPKNRDVADEDSDEYALLRYETLHSRTNASHGLIEDIYRRQNRFSQFRHYSYDLPAYEDYKHSLTTLKPYGSIIENLRGEWRNCRRARLKIVWGNS